jgi:hypothetical protein
MKKLLPLLVLALLATACGGEERWGGYTEGEAKDVLAKPSFREDLLQVAPPPAPGAVPYELLIPTKQQVEEADLRKVTLKGQEAWEYKNAVYSFCLYVWKNKNTGAFDTQVGACSAD